MASRPEGLEYRVHTPLEASPTVDETSVVTMEMILAIREWFKLTALHRNQPSSAHLYPTVGKPATQDPPPLR